MPAVKMQEDVELCSCGCGGPLQAKHLEREPTQVTELLQELRAAADDSRQSLENATIAAKGLTRRIRKTPSTQCLKVVTDRPPPPED